MIKKCFLYLLFFCTGPEITDELVKVLRKRLDETTLDIITVMLVRNCKLTPADVEVNSSLNCAYLKEFGQNYKAECVLFQCIYMALVNSSVEM